MRLEHVPGGLNKLKTCKHYLLTSDPCCVWKKFDIWLDKADKQFYTERSIIINYNVSIAFCDNVHSVFAEKYNLHMYQ